MQKIVIIEDEQSISETLALNLQMEGYQTSIIADGSKAMKDLSSVCESSLVILDVMLPGVNGINICRAIRERSDLPILMLSAKGSTSERIEGLKAGANDYLPKPFDLEELILRVQNLLPETKMKTALLKIGPCEVNFETFQCLNLETKEAVVLSKREIELLQLFQEKEGLVVSREEILDRLWGKDQFPTARTIDNYILTFRKLFESDPRNPLYFHSIRGVGYRFTGD
jgi:two-component system, OmpR family, alkaline phosphatase synthesis response regulator PhoP